MTREIFFITYFVVLKKIKVLSFNGVGGGGWVEVQHGPRHRSFEHGLYRLDFRCGFYCPLPHLAQLMTVYCSSMHINGSFLPFSSHLTCFFFFFCTEVVKTFIVRRPLLTYLIDNIKKPIITRHYSHLNVRFGEERVNDFNSIYRHIYNSCRNNIFFFFWDMKNAII